jgi:hypothetical protein
MRVDPALQGKPFVYTDMSHIGGARANIVLGSFDQNGGLRTFRAALNPGIVSDAEKGTVKSAMKRAILREWSKAKKPGDIITGDARGLQDPINSIYDLNL